MFFSLPSTTSLHGPSSRGVILPTSMTTTFTSWKPILPASLRSIPALPPSLPLRLTRLQLRLRPSPRLWPHGLARRAPARHCTGLPGPANGTNWHGPARPVLSRARPGSARPGSSRPESTLLRLLSRVLCVWGGSSIERQWHLLFNWLHAPCKTGVAGCRVLQGRPRPHSLACRCSAACRVETMQRIAYSAPLHSGGPGSRRRGRAGKMRRRGPGRVE